MEVAEILSMKYPFGREHEASIQLLFRSFCNNLFIGQFECARASIKELHSQSSFLRHPVKEILKRALEAWCKSDSVLHPLTWTCFVEYKEIEDSTSQGNRVKTELEFRYLLAQLCTDCDPTHLQELYSLHNGDSTDGISTGCEKYLIHLLVAEPALSVELFKFLPCSDIIYQCNNIMIDALQLSFDNKNKKSLCCLLSLVNIDLHTDGTKDRVEILLKAVIKSCKGSHWMSVDEINRAVSCCEDTELYTLTQSVISSNDAEDTQSALYDKWMRIALNTVSNQSHFFDVIMSQANLLMKSTEYEDLVGLLDTEGWRPLLPAIFHLAWRQCYSTEQSHKLITAFSNLSDTKLKTLLDQHQRIDVIEQSLNLSSDEGKRADISSGMLSVGFSHSVLHALLMCLDDLHLWSYQKMMQTLSAKSAYALLRQSESDFSDSDSLSMEQQRDISLFSSFYIINCALQSIQIASDDASTKTLSTRYTESVLPLLEKVKVHLSELRPLTLRLEVLEDIFSALFSLASDFDNLSISESASNSATIPTPPHVRGVSEEEHYYSAKEALSPQKPLKTKQTEQSPSLIKRALLRKSAPTAKTSELSDRSSDENTIRESLPTAVGFLANDFLVRDLLSILKDALTDLNAANFEMASKPEMIESEAELSRLTLTAVNASNFLSRGSQLQQRVSEAVWRYQLILQDSIITREYGSTVVRSVGHDQNLDDEGFAAYERSLYKSQTKRFTASGQQRTTESSFESEASSEFQTYSSGAANSGQAGAGNTSRNKRYKKKKSRIGTNSNATAPCSKLNLISRMLSSPVSLLNMCIKRQSSVQADQVMKLMNLGDQQDGKAFQFSLLYKTLLHQLTAQSEVSNSTTSRRKGLTGGLDLSSIRRSFASTLNVMEDGKKAVELSTSALIPSSVNLTENQIKKFLGLDSNQARASAMVLLDLAMVATSDAQLCQELLASTQKLLTTPAKTPSGLQTLAKRCISVNEEALSSDQTKIRQLLSLAEDNLSVRTCLLSNLLSLDVTDVRTKLKPLIKINEELTQIDKAISAWRKTGKGERLVASSPIKSLIHTLQDTFPESRQYLSDLYEQINLLHKLIVENTQSAPGSMTSPFAVLQEGPAMIMGRLMFDKNVEPSKLESVASQVRLDLTHVIVRSCCLPVRCKPLQQVNLSPPVETIQSYGYRVVLNGTVDNKPSELTLSPIDVVQSCLIMLLSIVKDSLSSAPSKILTKETVEDVRSMPQYSEFCKECLRLQAVSLSALSTDQEKRSFFVNLHNLVSLHAIIEHLSSSPSKQSTEDSISNLLSFHLRMCYSVGELGICSIFELQQFLLKVSNKVKQLDLSMEHPWFRYAPDYNPLTVFLLYDGSMNLLPVKCVTTESVERDIAQAVNMFMKHAVCIYPKDQQIEIPELLMRTRADLTIESAGQAIPTYEHADLLLWILEYQPATRWSEIKVIMDKLEHQNDLESAASHSTTGTADDEPSSMNSLNTEILASVRIVPANHRPGLCLDVKAALLASQDALSMAEDRESSTELSSSYRLTRSDAILHKAKFKISNVAIQYLREKSPVVAMLLDIIDDNILLNSDISNNQRFNSETLHREYVNLHRYLEQYILPMCVSIDEDIDSVDKMSTVHLPEHMKTSILTHKSCLHIQYAATKCLDILCTSEKYDSVIVSIDKLLGMVYNPPQDWLALKDFALIQCAAERVSSESLACIKQLCCERLQSHIAISCLHKSRWTVDKCLQILPQCERRLVDRGDTSLVPHLQTIVERMSVFHRIMLHAQAKQDIEIDGCSSNVVKIMSSGWQDVSEMLNKEPSAVFHLLFDAQEFLFAKKLTDMITDVDTELKMLVYVRYAVRTLDTTKKMTKLGKLLSSTLKTDQEWTYMFCLELLHELTNPDCMLTVVQFIMSEMMESLVTQRKEGVELCYTGIKMLMCLESDNNSQYKSLIFSPLLMFEQLLMNAKISLAARVLPILCGHEEMFDSGECELKFREHVNELLVKYAEKAVDFPVLYVSSDHTDSMTGSLSPRLRSVRTMANFGSPANQTASPLQKALLGSSLKRYSNMSQSPLSKRMSRITTAPGNLSEMGGGAGTPSLDVTSSTDVTGSPAVLSSPLPKKKFMLPERAPPKEDWVPDDQAERCMVCRLETFSMFNRRHHCRRCGRLVCASCSSRTAPVGGRSVRVCDDCYDLMFKSREILDQQEPNVKKLREKLSAASPPTTLNTPSYQVTVAPVDFSSPEWCLTPEDELNGEIRNDFFYDHVAFNQAPSVSLCTDILKLYDDSIQCGKHMLSLCERLSHIIKPIRPEAINQEVDYNLVISMMKFLLLNAKLLFMREHYADGVVSCETYSNIVEVLSLLLSDYYLDLPTVEELCKLDNIRRLRDRLMEDERPELAMEISTKFALETIGIWSHWGLSCLRKADYTGARDKFSKFMKPPMDKHSPSIAYSSVLNDIISTIEGFTAQTTGSYTQVSIQATLNALTSSSHDIGKTVPLLEWDAAQLDENQQYIQECLYYLKLYGNHQLIINFYRKHGFWQKAVQYCLDKKCSTDIFVTCLFSPAVRDGYLSQLQDQLLLVDPSLQKWNTYLTAVCRSLAKSSQYHTLYQIQLFTKDFIRAAMTCVQMFYLDKSKTYADLAERCSHLEKALDHYQSYLNPAKWDKIPRHRPQQHGRSVESSVRLSLAESDVKKNMLTVKLQIEVTKFVSSTTSRREPAVTLFGDNQQKTILASKVILAGKSINDGFSLAFRIIQDYQLETAAVYKLVAESLGDCRYYSHIKQFISCIKDSGLSDPQLHDRVLLTAIKAAGPSESSQSKDIEALSKLLRYDSSKVEAYIWSGKLRSAYLLAIKLDSLETISRISAEAEKLNQMSVKSICDKYIKQKRGH